MRTPRPFWSLVDKRGSGECWPWLGRRDADGYGVYDADGKAHRANRVALGLGTFEGGGTVARHACDNPPCCNPAHLLPGSSSANSHDMYDRDRRVDKLTSAQRAEVRAAAAVGGRGILSRVAKAFGVTPQYVGRLARQAVAA